MEKRKTKRIAPKVRWGGVTYKLIDKENQIYINVKTPDELSEIFLRLYNEEATRKRKFEAKHIGNVKKYKPALIKFELGNPVTGHNAYVPWSNYKRQSETGYVAGYEIKPNDIAPDRLLGLIFLGVYRGGYCYDSIMVPRIVSMRYTNKKNGGVIWRHGGHKDNQLAHFKVLVTRTITIKEEALICAVDGKQAQKIAMARPDHPAIAEVNNVEAKNKRYTKTAVVLDVSNGAEV